jgi:hypothetical protein
VQPGERITLIKKIAARLASESFHEIDLILRQFGLGLSVYYPDADTVDSFMSVVQSIQDAEDETLVDLHALLFGDSVPMSATEERRAAIAPEIWKLPPFVARDDVPPEEPFRLFISHTSSQKDQAGFLQSALGLFGISAFVAHADINSTREWQDVIESALETCDALLAYLTEDFPRSAWTDQEVGFVIGRSVLILPVKIDRDPYGFIGKYQAVNGAGKDIHKLAEEIANVVVAHPLTAKRMAAATVRTFANSYSFDNARANLLRLQQIPRDAWTPGLASIVRAGFEENDQLREANAPTPTGWRSMRDVVAEMFGTLGL